MGDYILNTVNYDYKTLNHEGFGGVCKYIAPPKKDGLSRLLIHSVEFLKSALILNL